MSEKPVFGANQEALGSRQSAATVLRESARRYRDHAKILTEKAERYEALAIAAEGIPDGPEEALWELATATIKT